MTKRNALFERLRLALAGYAVALLFAYAAAHSLLTSYYLDVSVLTCLAYAAGALLVFCVLFYNRYTMLATAAGLVVAVVVAYFSKFAWWISRFEEFSEALAASVPFLTGQAGLDEAYVPFLAASVCVLAALVARLTAFRFRGTGFLAVASLALFLTEWFLGHRQILLDMVLAAAAILIVLAVSFARKLYALHDDSAHAPHPDDGGDGTDEPAFVVNAPRLSVVAACVLPLALFMSALSFTALPETSDQFKNDAFVAKVDEFVLRLRGGETEGGVSTVAALGATQSTGRLGGASFQSKLPAFTISGSYPTHLRGAVYDTYTGYSFEDGGSVPFHPLAEGYTELADILFFPASERVLSRMPPASYTITPRGRTTLVYSLSVPERLIAPSDLVFFVSDQGELACETGIPAGTSYTVEGRALPAADRLTPDDLVTGGARPGYSKQLLQLPPDLPESVRALALDLVDGIENPVDRAAAIQRYLKQNFTYTLTPPAVPQGRDFVDWFLESKEGYCTYFAAAMTVLCRAADVPARYVEGFYVGTSPVGGGETVITYESAH
ncbi:transglutaminase-like domain-containing protein, partial [Oscillospiraceae bacterium OttesenSCG-928-G22]|nr:transglutaminase-like domain-containing protein [Oscillospiraceae bacterium OttesenSCG-928-G22]